MASNKEAFIAYILAEIGKANFLVDIGAGKNYYLSNTKFLQEKGYSGIWIDGEKSDLHPEIKQHWVTRENIQGLLHKYECPHEFDLLCIDLDGNDWYILEQILVYYRPRLIVAEFNANISPSKCVAIEYDPKHIWNNDDYFWI